MTRETIEVIGGLLSFFGTIFIVLNFSFWQAIGIFTLVIGFSLLKVVK